MSNKMVELARKQLGIVHGDKYHRQIVDGYNKITPRPVGYQVNMTDDWCDVFITWLGDKTGMSNIIGRECGVQRHKEIFIKKGIWLGRSKPQAGDIVVFDWQGHSAGWADHIGLVERVNGNQITTIEGNTGSPRAVRRKQYAWNNGYIVGYARPTHTKGSKVEKTTPKRMQVVVDGYLGKDTVTSLQNYYGLIQDGEIWGQYNGNQATKAFNQQAVRYGKGGSPVVRALQKTIGTKVDGIWGVDTTWALQKYLGTTVDGVISRPSLVIKELQRRLNNGNL